MNVLDFREPVSAWTHAIGLALAVPAAVYLWWRGRGDRGKQVCLLIYGLGLVACYAGSTFYHGVQGSRERIAMFARLDLVGIYLLIAGSYTPMAWTLLRGRWRWITLTTVWSVAALASVLILSGIDFPRPLETALYLGLGWGVVACYVEIARFVPHRALLPLVGGGLFYSLGAVLNLLRWPVLWPGRFGTHDLFHLFVLAGSATHYIFVLAVVVPSGPGSLPRVSRHRDVPSRGSIGGGP